MFLAVDVGNSNIVVGIYDNDRDRWVQVWRVETDSGKAWDDFLAQLQSLLDAVEIKPGAITRSMVASVVPKITGDVLAAIDKLTNSRPIKLNHQTETGIRFNTHRPEEIGPDLIAGVVAAYHAAEQACIVVDFGTATTLMAVQEPGVLVGGAICAGLKITADSLVSRAAMLSDIPLEPPPNVLAKGTVEAMQSGLVLGHICMVEGLIDRMKQELGGDIMVWATGGLAEMLAGHTNHFDIVDPLLTLNGMRVIAEKIG